MCGDGMPELGIAKLWQQMTAWIVLNRWGEIPQGAGGCPDRNGPVRRKRIMFKLSAPEKHTAQVFFITEKNSFPRKETGEKLLAPGPRKSFQAAPNEATS